MKRRTEGDQLSKEDFERDEDDDDETPVGPFQRASEDELKSRKKFVLKRKDSSGAGASTAAPSNAFAGFAAASAPNPFSSSASMPSFSASGSTSAAPAANPFKGFASLTLPATSSSTSTTTANTFNVPLPAASTTALFDSTSVALSAQPAFTFNATNSTSSKPVTVSGSNNTNTVGTNGEYAKKMRKLNESFVKWADRQMTENAVAIWKDGVKDYLKHQRLLQSKLNPESSTAGSNGSNKSTLPSTSTSATTVTAAPKAPAAAEVSKPAAPPAFSFGTSSTAAAEKPAAAAAAAPFSSFSFNTPAVPPTASSSAAAAPAPFMFGASAPTTSSAAGSSSSSSAAPAAVFSGFSGFSAPSTTATTVSGSTAALGGFTGFSGFSSTAPATAAPSTGGFSFNAAPASTFSLPAAKPAATAEDGEEGGADEGEPILAPEKVLRNEADKDVILVDVNCKLFVYNKEEKEWRDLGKGPFRVTEDPDTKKQRMVMRNGTGKILLNAAFHKNFKVEMVKGGLKFSAFVAQEDSKGVATGGVDFRAFLCKCNDTSAGAVHAAMQKAAAAVTTA